MCSYSTGESGKGADVDKVRTATRLARDRRPELKIEGPIQYDAAVDNGVAKTKLPGSEVAGRATVFIFPDLNTGNNLYKAVQRSANAVAIGPILQGLNKPVNDLSRGATIPDIINTVAITAIQSQAVGAEDRGQRSEVRGQRSRGQRTEFGSGNAEFGMFWPNAEHKGQRKGDIKKLGGGRREKMFTDYGKQTGKFSMFCHLTPDTRHQLLSLVL